MDNSLLITLPRELRNEIYRYAMLVDERCGQQYDPLMFGLCAGLGRDRIDVAFRDTDTEMPDLRHSMPSIQTKEPSITRTCRQLREEASLIYYSQPFTAQLNNVIESFHPEWFVPEDRPEIDLGRLGRAIKSKNPEMLRKITRLVLVCHPETVLSKRRGWDELCSALQRCAFVEEHRMVWRFLKWSRFRVCLEGRYQTLDEEEIVKRLQGRLQHLVMRPGHYWQHQTSWWFRR